MRINDIAQNIIANQSGNKGIVHGMNKRTNSYGQTGMYVNGTTSVDRKIVKVSDDITEKVINLARSEFLNNFGVTDGEEFNALRAKYVSGSPESERLNVAWTLGETFFNESQRIKGIVQDLYPNWRGNHLIEMPLHSSFQVVLTKKYKGLDSIGNKHNGAHDVNGY